MKLKAVLMIFTVAVVTKTLMDPTTMKVSGEVTVPLDSVAFDNNSLAGKKLAHTRSARSTGELEVSSLLAWTQVCRRCKAAAA